jgi:hypothetical protein
MHLRRGDKRAEHSHADGPIEVKLRGVGGGELAVGYALRLAGQRLRSEVACCEADETCRSLGGKGVLLYRSVVGFERASGGQNHAAKYPQLIHASRELQATTEIACTQVSVSVRQPSSGPDHNSECSTVDANARQLRDRFQHRAVHASATQDTGMSTRKAAAAAFPSEGG